MKIVTEDDELSAEVVVQGDEEEVTRFQRALDLREKGAHFRPHECPVLAAPGEPPGGSDPAPPRALKPLPFLAISRCANLARAFVAQAWSTSRGSCRADPHVAGGRAARGEARDAFWLGARGGYGVFNGGPCAWRADSAPCASPTMHARRQPTRGRDSSRHGVNLMELVHEKSLCFSKDIRVPKGEARCIECRLHIYRNARNRAYGKKGSFSF